MRTRICRVGRAARAHRGRACAGQAARSSPATCQRASTSPSTPGRSSSWSSRARRLSQGLSRAETRFVCPRRRRAAGTSRSIACTPTSGVPWRSMTRSRIRATTSSSGSRSASTARDWRPRCVDSRLAPSPSPESPLAAGGPRPRGATRGHAHLGARGARGDGSDGRRGLGGSRMIRRGAIAWRRRRARPSPLPIPTTYTLAKTGTTLADGGVQEGRVVAWRPEVGEAIVVRAPGVSGRDAARIARMAWDAAAVVDERGRACRPRARRTSRRQALRVRAAPARSIRGRCRRGGGRARRCRRWPCRRWP